MEERKKRLRKYFPNVDMRTWDMETDTKGFDSWYWLLDWLSTPTRKLTMKDKMEQIIKSGTIIHPGPIRCAKCCPDKEPCDENFFRKKMENYKVILNTKPKPDFIL